MTVNVHLNAYIIPDSHKVFLAEHASDVQRLRGSLNEAASSQYMTALANIDTTVESDVDINRTGANITALSKLVVARNALVDSAMAKIS